MSEQWISDRNIDFTTILFLNTTKLCAKLVQRRAKKLITKKKSCNDVITKTKLVTQSKNCFSLESRFSLKAKSFHFPFILFALHNNKVLLHYVMSF